MLFFDYDLPVERIAQRPVGKGEARAKSKLLCARCSSQDVETLSIEDRVFSDLADILCRGDLLVLNNSQVVPCRYFVKLEARERPVEILFVNIESKETDGTEIWQALAKPMRALKVGAEIELATGLLAKILGRNEDGTRVRIALCLDGRVFKTVSEALSATGYMPIPPYIRDGVSDVEDVETYQTIYAKSLGSIACPTAGLHFTQSIFDQLKERGVQCEFVTLHVGTSSFLPVKDNGKGIDLSSHQMEFERYSISAHTASEIIRAKNEGRRVIAVGTTSVRALESAAIAHVDFCHDMTGSTDLFITQGFQFKVIDAMITNFHQPRSTHLLLVAAFLGESAIHEIYQYALKADYRFLSYGDAMLLDRCVVR